MHQLICEMVKEDIIGKIRERLQSVVEIEEAKVSEEIEGEEEQEKRYRVIEYQSQEMVEKIEYIKKKIN